MPRTNEPVDCLVGRNVRIFRKAKGFSQSALGDAIGVSFQQVQKYESGTNRIGSSRLASIAKILGVPIERFFKGAQQADVDTDPLSDALASPYALELLQAFAKVGDERIRQSLVSLIENIADTRRN
jgi:transcriptional regulator with XRE-family HTH domain